MKVLELFCGTKSISKAFELRGHDTLTVDFDKQFNPDLCIDILNFSIKDLPKEWRKPDVIWASPPCQTFSMASVYVYRQNGHIIDYRAYIGLALAMKTVQFIQEVNPKFWFIENPTALLRKQHFMQGLHRKAITYCQYGHKCMKPTDIWTNDVSWIAKKRCKNGDNCHESAKRGSDRGTQSQSRCPIKRAIIPYRLCEEIVDVCEGKLKVVQEVLKNGR